MSCYFKPVDVVCKIFFRLKIKTSDLASQPWPLPTAAALTPCSLQLDSAIPFTFIPGTGISFVSLHISLSFWAIVPVFPLLGLHLAYSPSFGSLLKNHFHGAPFGPFPMELESSSSAPRLPAYTFQLLLGACHARAGSQPALSMLCPL